MKKLLIVLAACMLVAGVAGRANASFSVGDLIRVVYQTTASGGTLEEATDLGSAAAIEANPSSLADSGYNLLTGNGTSNFGSLSNLEVAYFAVNGSTPPTATEFWTSGTATGTETNNGYTTFKNGISVTAAATISGPNGYTLYSNGTANAWELVSNPTSYYKGMDLNNANATGSFDKFYTAGAGDGEVALVSGGSVSQGLFDWKTPTQLSTISASIILVTSYSGGVISTTAQSNAAPIPPSVLLFGSGLLGLIGIRRKNLFNC